MKTKIVETHWTESPVISVIQRKGYVDVEKDLIPYIKREIKVKFLFMWFTKKKQVIRQRLNDYIHSATLGTRLTYTWKPEFEKVDQVIYKG